jgi:hypothetical protein
MDDGGHVSVASKSKLHYNVRTMYRQANSKVIYSITNKEKLHLLRLLNEEWAIPTTEAFDFYGFLWRFEIVRRKMPACASIFLLFPANKRYTQLLPFNETHRRRRVLAGRRDSNLLLK